MSEKPNLQARLRDVPHKPGVYVMRDRLGRVIYVGKARDLKKRLGNYFQPSRAKQVDRKTRALIESVWDFELHQTRNEPEALLLEGKLIKDFRPRYNISFRDDKRFLMIRVHLGDDFPRLALTRLKKDDGAKYIGPFAHSGALKTTINWLNKHFGLRVCRPLRPDEGDYKHCSNDIIKNCCAPCVGRVTVAEYKSRMEQAVEFLSGKGDDLVAALEEEMHKAARAMDFEKAAELRDMVMEMKRTVMPTRTFERGARKKVMSTIDPMADVLELQELLQMERAPLVMECFDIANIGTAHCVASMVRFKNGVPDNANYRRYRIRAVSGQNDFVSMAEVVRRRYSRILLEGSERLGPEAEGSQENVVDAMRRLERTQAEAQAELDSEGLAEGEDAGETYDEAEMPDGSVTAQRPGLKAKAPAERKGGSKFVSLPDLVIVDGGKGQLGMAVAELQRLGLHGLPVIGLAKEREEIFFPDTPEPLLIPHDRGALKLMQRIRDEAHRWANGYHQLLLRRRVAESILDDCPGVSANRKTLLLKAFGSVARLRLATAADIAKVKGIGPALATEVVDYLATHSRSSGED
jgi:excinuclease ABC subunit C